MTEFNPILHQIILKINLNLAIKVFIRKFYSYDSLALVFEIPVCSSKSSYT